MTYPARGGLVGTWDTPIDTDFDVLDAVIGGTTAIAAAGAGGSAITQTQANNRRIRITGVLTQNYLLTFPAIGGLWVIANDTTGNFTITANVTGSAATALNCPQGARTLVSSNATDLSYADDGALAKVYTQLGTPQGSVAGSAATTSGGPTSLAWDGTNRNLYAAITTGTSATTVWGPVAAKLTPQGYLTASADTSNPIITADITTSTLSYVPYVGNWMQLSDGTTLYPYQFSAMTLTLTNGIAASNTLYDVFGFWNSGSPIIGVGPAWNSSTVGSCSRSGNAALVRLLGAWVNTGSITLSNGGSTYSPGAMQAVYLGTIYVDSTAGNVTCHRSYGNTTINTWTSGNVGRKFGVWNPYNRERIYLKAGDSTPSWAYSSSTFRASDALSTNSAAALCGLAEEYLDAAFLQQVNIGTNTFTPIQNGIGSNSITTTSGTRGSAGASSNTGSISTNYNLLRAEYLAPPVLGLQVFTCLESAVVSATVFGTEANMVLSLKWNG